MVLQFPRFNDWTNAVKNIKKNQTILCGIIINDQKLCGKSVLCDCESIL